MTHHPPALSFRLANWAFVVAAGFVLALAFVALVSCQCEQSDEAIEQTKQGLRPLEEVGVPREIQAEIYPVIGTTRPRPAALVLGMSSELCSSAREMYQKRAHVLCRLGSGDQQVDADEEMALLTALAFFKKRYSDYLQGRPAHLITDAGMASLGWKMLLADPSVFGLAYLAGLSADALGPTTLFALHSKGTQLLVVDLPPTERLELLSQVARRGGLELAHVEPGPQGRTRGLQRLIDSDQRLEITALKP